MIKRTAAATYAVMLFVLSLVAMHTAQAQKKDTIGTLMRKVCDWQIKYLDEKGFKWAINEWVYSTYYLGLYETGKLLKEQAYIDKAKYYCEKANWKVGEGKRRYFADDYLIGDLYCKLYQDTRASVRPLSTTTTQNAVSGQTGYMIADFQQMADELLVRDTVESLEIKNMNVFRVWSWCDALFMGPPGLQVLANTTGNAQYRAISDSFFWQTTAYLYDKDEHLFYRDSRYFTKKEKNGEKKFWSRGNGWVMGGIARILKELPKKHPSRQRYIKLFQAMAAKILSLQQADGMWRSSLLDPASYPGRETSGTGFYCYAFAWGVNHGILPKKVYKPAAKKAWDALTACVNAEGRLGYVQKIGEEPVAATEADTDGFGVGAFLLAAKEMIHLK
jgi:unsaturated rhamnogalacturonyl hydrolase